MFGSDKITVKRIIAMVLVFAMMLGMVDNVVPRWFTAVAEASAEGDDSSGGGSGSSDGDHSSHAEKSASQASEHSGGSGATSGSSDGGSSSASSSGSSDGGSSSASSSGSSDGGSSSASSSGSSDGGSSSASSSGSDSGSGASSGSNDAGSSSASSDAGSSSGSASDIPATQSEDSASQASDSWGDGGASSDSSDAASSGESSQSEGAASPASDADEPASDAPSTDGILPDAHGDGDQANDTPAPTQDDEGVSEPAADVTAQTGATDGAAAPSEGSDAEGGTDETPVVDAPGADDVAPEGGEAEGEDETDIEPSATLALTGVLSPVTAEGETASDGDANSFTATVYTAPVVLADGDSAKTDGDSTEADADKKDGDEADKKVPTLQEKIDDALAAVDGKLAGRLKVVLEKNTAYGGDVKIDTDTINRAIDKDFYLEFAAEDAGDDGTGADGSGSYTGTMTIQGINVAIRGIGLTGKVTVADAKLNYTGSKAGDTVNVEVGKGGVANLETGAGDDQVTVTATDDGQATITTSEGNDKVNLTNNSTKAQTVDTGSGSDSVTLTSKQGTTKIATGEDNDTVEVTLSGSATQSVDIDTSDGDDKVKITGDAVTGKVQVGTGEGNDTVDAVLDTAGQGIVITTGAGDDTVNLSAGTGDKQRYGKVEVDLGGGTNKATVDVELSDAVADVAGAVLIKGAGDEQLHMKGTLDPKTADDKRVDGTESSLVFVGPNGNKLNLQTSGIDSITDELVNKRTVVITPDESGNVDYTADLRFVNYVISVPAQQLNNVRISSNGNLTLTSLLINTPTTKGGDNVLTISEGAVIDARGLNLVVDAANIDIQGILMAKLVEIRSAAGTGKYGRDLGALYTEYKKSIDVPVLGVVGAGIAAGAVKAADMFNAEDEAKINIGEKAAIYSGGNVLISATVDQMGGIVDLAGLVGLPISISPTNVVNVKIGHASVDVAGKVVAGVTNMDDVAKAVKDTPNAVVAKTDGGTGTVQIKAESKAKMGMDMLGMSPNKDGLALAVSVADLDAAINVQKGAEIEAAGDVTLSTRTDLAAGTWANAGTLGMPVAVAVAVLLSDSHNVVAGKVTSKTGDVNITAAGSVDATTTAIRGEDQKGVSGGYVAVSVVLQDVEARLTETAQISAAGSVKVQSTAEEKVNNTAQSSPEKKEDDPLGDLSLGGIIDSVIKPVKEFIWPKVRDFITSLATRNKVEAALAKLSTSSRSVRLDDNAERKGNVKTDMKTVDGKVQLQVDLEPRQGYQVDKVIIRTYSPGDATFTPIIWTPAADELTKTFDLGAKINAIVFVDYKQADKASEDKSSKGLFDDAEKKDSVDLQKVLDDVKGGTSSDSELTSALKESGDEGKNVTLKLTGGTGGHLLTYDYLANQEGKNLEKVQMGQEYRLIVNPDPGKKLKTGSLKVTYKVKEKVKTKGEDGKEKEEEKEVTKTIVVNADSRGRYAFKVPDDVISGSTLEVKAEFENGTQDNEADDSQNQVSGAAGVAVATNDGRAVIDAGANVTAGGRVDVSSKITTNVINLSDGTAISKQNSPTTETKKEKDPYTITRPEMTAHTSYDVEGHMFALKVGQTVNGQAVAEPVSGQEYAYTFTTSVPDEAEGYKLTSATITYYNKSKTVTAQLKAGADGGYKLTLKKGEDGNYTIDPDCLQLETKDGKTPDLGIDKGSIIEAGFAFGKEGEYGVAHKAYDAQIFGGPVIETKYNEVKTTKDSTDKDKTDKDDADKAKAAADKTGTLTFKETKKAENGNTLYVFEAKPETDRGYVLDGSVKATWGTLFNQTSVELEKQSDGLWVLDATKANVPMDQKISVTAAFKAEYHEFKVDENLQNKAKDIDGKEVEIGKVELHDEKVKQGDKPKVTVKTDPNYAVSDIVVTYTVAGQDGKDETKTLKLTDKDSKISKAKDDDGKEIDGVYTVDIPGAKADTQFKVSATFKRKAIGVSAVEKDGQTAVLSEYNAAVGDKVTVKPSEEKVKQGYKVSKVEVNVAGNTTLLVDKEGDAFEVPAKDKEGKAITDATKLIVTATLALKDVALEGAKLENGTLTPANARADAGETVTVKVKPDDGFKVKKGTLKAVLVADDGSYSEEVYMLRKDDTTYLFDMPSDIADPGKVKITFTGEFEPGLSDSSMVDTSLGAGLAVSVVSSEGRAEVAGSVTGSNVSVNADADGQVKTEAKAGYSKGNVGIGGAVAVQVASIDNKALIHDGAGIVTDAALTMAANSKVTFGVTADAAGTMIDSKEVGVGAGVAVAVNGADNYAAMSDGAKLATSKDALTSLSLSATQTVSDSVVARGGAAGGTAVTPAALVDVTGADSEAYVGKAADALKIDGDLSVTAKLDATHTMSADASAGGRQAGVGAAIVVSVISDVANAQLNQSVTAKNVTVSADTASSVTSAATAAVTGGQQAGKSADQQADGLAGAAGKLAGNNTSKSVSADKIDKASSDQRQKAETSEGQVGVAGAVAVNVQDSLTNAEIMDGVDIHASQNLTVTSSNGTTAKVKANASTTNSNVGVGVGVAVSIVALDNLAHIGDGAIEAAMLKVAADTKITEPAAMQEKKPVPEENKVETVDGVKTEIAEIVLGFTQDLIEEMGLDTFISKDLVSNIVSNAFSEAAWALFKGTGVEAYLGKGTFKDKFKEASDALGKVKDGLSKLPDQLEGILKDSVSDLMKQADLNENELKAMLQALKDGVNVDGLTPDQLMGEVEAEAVTFMQQAFSTGVADQAQTACLNVLTGVKDGVFEYLRAHVADILSGAIYGKEGDQLDDLVSQVEAEIGKYVEAEIKQFISGSLEGAVETFKSTVAQKLAQVTGAVQVDTDSIMRTFDKLKKVFDAKTLKGTYDKAVAQATEAFNNIEGMQSVKKMIGDLSKIDFKKMISENLRQAAKQASVTLTNEALAAMSEHLDLAVETAQVKATGHVIDTQAISGAGVKEVGVAGAVAVTVVNANTRATIKDADSTLNVTGEVTVTANELRSVHNVASASSDIRGNAADNKSQEKAANSDVGSNGSAKKTVTGDHVTVVTTNGGGSAKINPQDVGDARPKVYLTLKNGYQMPEGNKLTLIYKDKNGKEQKGTVTAEYSDSDGWFVDTSKISADTVPTKNDISIEFTPVAKSYLISAPDILADGNVKSGAVEIKAQNGELKGDALSTTVGDRVEVTVHKQDGMKVSELGYHVTFDNGTYKEVKLAKVSETADTITYAFSMPDANVDSFVVRFEKTDPYDSGTKAGDALGHGVGVGGSFALVYGDTATVADTGSRNVKSGALTVKADQTHTEDIAAAAGTDPLTGAANTENMKRFGVDASVALNILNNDVRASVGAASVDAGGDLKINAHEDSASQTTTSAFAVGGATAVGASVAVNLSSSDVNAALSGSATAAGDVDVSAISHSEDVTTALASAMGADIARATAKLGDQSTSAVNKFLDGSYLDSKADSTKGKNDTAKKINEKLDEKKRDDDTAKGKATSGNLSTSQNVLRSQAVEAETEDAGNEGGEAAEGEITDATGQKVTAQKQSSTYNKLEVAAAVGVTVADHAVHTVIGGSVTADKAISATAENTGNFNTQGTGSALSMADKANSIAAGVAVSVNEDQATVQVKGDLISKNKEDIGVTSKLTLNMDGDFKGKLAAQSLSGAASGADSAVSIGGAVSVVRSKATSSVDIAGGTNAQKRQLTGGNITVSATDKSKLAARAGGLSVSKGSTLGVGLGSTTIISGNTVTANVGDNANITGGAFTLTADKQAVSQADYTNLVAMKKLITDSSQLTDEERKNAQTGLIDIHKESGGNYQAQVNLSSDKLLGMVDGMNILSSQNTYAEAIAGSVMTGDAGKVNLSLSAAVARMDNNIQAKLGTGATVTLTKDDTHTGDMALTANDGNNARVIAGALAAGSAKNAVGATVSVVIDSDTVTAESGGASDAVTADGDITQTATTDANMQVITAAMAGSAGNSMGGAVNVVIANNRTNNRVQGGTYTSGQGSVTLGSAVSLDLLSVSGSVDVAAGSGTGVAAGGTLNVIVDRTEANTTLAAATALKAHKDLTVTADAANELKSAIASASIASGTGVAGAVNVIVSGSKAVVEAGEKLNLTAETGDMKVKATSDAWVLNASLALAGASSTAVGAQFNVNVFDRVAHVNLADGTLTSGGNLTVQSSGSDVDILGGLGLSGTVSGSALSGTFGALVEKNDIGTNISSGVTATAGKNAAFESNFGDFTVLAAGNIAGSLGTAGLGAATVVAVKNNAVKTTMGASAVRAKAAGDDASKSFNGWEYTGVYVGATAREEQYVGAAGVATSGGTALNGVIAALVNNNVVTADASSATLTATADDEGKSGGSVTVRAVDGTQQMLLTGGLNVSGGMGIGAAVVTLVSNKDVSATVKQVTAASGVEVTALNADDITDLAISAGISGGTGVQLGAAVQVLKSKAKALSLGDVKITGDSGSYDLTAQNDLSVTAAAAEVGIGSSAVTPVGMVTVFEGETDARQAAGSTASTVGDINIKATTNKKLNLYTLGAAAGGMGLSGTVDMIISKDQTRAVAEKGAKLATTKGKLNIYGESDYALSALSGSVGAGQIAVAVNAIVSVLKSNTLSELAGTATTGGDVNVEAHSQRSVFNALATVAAGQTAVGVSALALVAGTKMSQDAADMIAYGNAKEKTDDNRTFDAGKFTEALNTSRSSLDTKYLTDGVTADLLSDAVTGNGRHESEIQVGSATGSGDDKVASFDGSSTYRSADFDDQNYDDAEGEIGRGENLGRVKQADGTWADDPEGVQDTRDIEAARELNVYDYQGDSDLSQGGDPAEGEDAVIARVTADAVVDTTGKVNVLSEQPVGADLIGANLAVGQAGVGVSLALGVLHSNVSASSMGDIRRAAGISVTANSVAGTSASGENDFETPKDNADDVIVDLMSNNQQDKEATKQSILDKLNPSDRAIRVFGLAAGAGEAGVAVSAGILLTDNITQAVLGGKPGTAASVGDVTVQANQNYRTVLAATGTLAAGAVAANASLALAQANGAVTAKIDRGTAVNAQGGTVRVNTAVNVDADAAAATVSGGAAAVNAGLGLALNRMKQTTGIGAGAVIGTPDSQVANVAMYADSQTSAESYLVGAAVGGVGVTLNAAVSDVNTVVDTYIGEDQDEAGNPLKPVTINTSGTAAILNEIYTLSAPHVLSVAGGGAAVGGNVLLAFDRTRAMSRLTNAQVKARDLGICSKLQAEATASLASLQVGGAAIGLSVNYADIQADNRAFLGNSQVDVTGDLLIDTDGSRTAATADTLAGTVSFATASMNAAVARNRSVNYAVLYGEQDVQVGKDLVMNGLGESDATATLTGFDLSAAKIAASTVVAMNSADARTKVQIPTQEDDPAAGDPPILKVAGLAKLNATQEASTTANVTTGGGALLDAKMNVALAYGRTNAVVEGDLTRGVDLGGISATVTGKSDTTSVVDNAKDFSLLSAAAYYGAAYSQDLFTSKIIVSGDNSKIGDHGVNLLTDYDTTATASVTPSTGGILGDIAVNVAMAKNTVLTGAEFEASQGSTDIEGDVKINTHGTATTDARIEPANITDKLQSVNAVRLGVNYARSDLSTVQASTLRIGGNVNIAGDVDVRAQVKDESSQALASIGSSGTSQGVELSLVSLDASRATAIQNMTSTAAVLGVPSGTQQVSDPVDQGHYEDVEVGHYDYDIIKRGWHLQRDEKGNLIEEGQHDQWTVVVYQEDPDGNRTNEVIVGVYATQAEAQKACDDNSFHNSPYWSASDGQKKGIEHVTSKLIEHDPLFNEDGDDNIYYDWVTETVQEWKENWVDEPSTRDVYDATQNSLTARSLNIYSGSNKGKTRAEARSDGAASVNMASLGSLHAESLSSDDFSVLFEGVNAVIKGDATLKAESNTDSVAAGSSPGTYSGFEASASDVKANVGDRNNTQYTAVVVGEGAALKAANVDITASNNGMAASSIDKTTYSLASLQSATMPTESWYTTLVSIGAGASLEATGETGHVNISTADAPNAQSVVDNAAMGLALNYNDIKGDNTIIQVNNLDIGEGATVKANGLVKLHADQKTLSRAETSQTSGSLAVSASTAYAQNDVDRVVRVNIDRDASIESAADDVKITARAGVGDAIYTRANVESSGFIALGNTRANADVTTNAEVILEGGVNIASKKGDVDIQAQAGGYSEHGDIYTNSPKLDQNPGVLTIAQVKSAGGVPLPNAVAKNTLEYYTFVSGNRKSADGDPTGEASADQSLTKTVNIQAANNVSLRASNDDLWMRTFADAEGKGGAGVTNATSWNAPTLTNTVWLDNVNLKGKRTSLAADNGGSPVSDAVTNANTHVMSDAYGSLKVVGGKIEMTSRITGTQVNQIRTRDVKKVGLKGTVSNTHPISSPGTKVYPTYSQDYDRLEIKIFGIPITLTSATKKTELDWYVYDRCDFCNIGTEVDVSPTDQESVSERYKLAYDRALVPRNTVDKALSELTKIIRTHSNGASSFDSASPATNYAEDLFYMGIKPTLLKDVLIDRTGMDRYLRYTNSHVRHSVYLLPNATRLAMGGDGRIHYIGELLSGSVTGDGITRRIVAVTALDEGAYRNPILPIGDSGSLDFSSHSFSLPDHADFNLYLCEVSGEWLLDRFGTGAFRALSSGQRLIDEAVENRAEPSGSLLEGVMQQDGIWWIGDTPETAVDHNQPLYYLTFDAETDLVEAFRTSLDRLAAALPPITESLMIYRDHESDQAGIEKYNCLFFDTPAGERAVVRVITDVLSGHRLFTPCGLSVVLRVFWVEGAELPAFSINDHLYVLTDGTRGHIELFGGLYTVNYDGATYDSDYTRIEGLDTDDPKVILKAGQPTWPEYTSKEEAVSLNGEKWVFDGTEWVEELASGVKS